MLSCATIPTINKLQLIALLQAALVEMNDSALTVDQLDALSRAVPDDQERKDIRLYLQVSISPAAWCSHLLVQSSVGAVA